MQSNHVVGPFLSGQAIHGTIETMKITRNVTIGILAAGILGGLMRTDCPNARIVFASERESKIIAEFVFEPGEPQLTIPFRLGNGDYRFGLATSKGTLFGKSFADRLPRLPSEIDQSELSDVGHRLAPAVSVGSMTLRFPHSFVACNLLTTSDQFFSQCDAIAGLEILSQHIVQIDFDERTIRFLQTVPDNPGDRFEISSLQRKPRLRAVIVKGQFSGEPTGDFFIELESPDTIYIRSATYIKLLENGKIRQPHIESTFDTTSAPLCLVGTLNSFTVGRFTIENLRAIPHHDNVIGVGFLSRFVVTFDFPRGIMYLRPGKQFGRPEGYDVSGLFATMQDDSLEVSSCDFRSPAYKAGLQEQDAIIDVNGQPVNRRHQSSFRNQILLQGHTLQVHFKRDGVNHNVELKLPEIPRKSNDPASSIPRARFLDKVPLFSPRSPPSELSEIEEPSSPQNAEGCQRVRSSK